MKTTFRGALCALMMLLSVIFTACTGSQPSTASFQAMDTLMTLKVCGGKPDTCDQLQSRIETLDSLLDATDENSEIYRLNTEKHAAVSGDTAALLSESLSLCEQLDGTFDLTVYPAVQAWGFTTGDYRVPDDSELQALSESIDWRGVTHDGNTYTLADHTAVDLGAVAKGYAADVCAQLLQESGAQAAILNLGGTIRLCGKKPDDSRFTVGVADPDNPAAYFGTLTCDACTVATSGGYERYFDLDGRRYIHILDPKTAKPVDNGILSVTVVCDSGTRADALSTALFVMGLDKAAEYCQSRRDFDCIILTDEKNLYITEAIAADFTLGDGYDYPTHIIGSLS